MISIIAAYAANGVIGKDNAIPWHIPEDMAYFKKLTTGHTVIMGRNTYQSIVKNLGMPLPNRQNIVISKTIQSPDTSTLTTITLEEAIKKANVGSSEVFIIGGSKVYEAALKENLVDRMYITEIKADISGDTYFPEYSSDDWDEVERRQSKDKTHTYDFVVYQKKKTL